MRRFVVLGIFVALPAYAQVDTSMYNTGPYFRPIQPAPVQQYYSPPTPPPKPLPAPVQGDSSTTYRQNYEKNLPRTHACYNNGHGALICN